jgi:WD40 repeat protein
MVPYMLNSAARKILFAALLLTFAGLLGCGGGGSSGGSGGGGGGGGGTTVTSAHPPFRTRYLRTDLQYNPNAFQFFPPHFTAYDRTHKRFFVSNTTLNRIDVFDGSTESQIGTIVVPLPFGLDVAPDGSKLYVGTTFGDVYLVDPGAMQVVQRFASATLGPQGYTATQALILADGRLALMGALGGLYFDGSPSFAVWDPVANTLQEIPAGEFLAFGQIALSGDRTKILVGGANIQELLLYDPATNSSIISPFIGGYISNILGTPDGKRFFVFGSVADEVFDANTMAELGSFQSPCSYTSAAISPDGSAVFCSDQLGNILAYDSSTLAQKGWIQNFNVLDMQDHIVLSAANETGLIAGPIGHGIAFLDTQQMKSGTSGTDISISFLTPSTGPLGGGTAIQANYDVPVGVTVTKGTVYVGNGIPNNVSFSPVSINGEAPSASFSGVADFTVVLPDGSMDMMPEDFSYGPTIVEVSTNAASAEGGAQGAIFGYGLGQQPSDVQVSIGGQPATVVQVLPSVSPIFPYPFQMAAVIFTIPPGTAGATSTVTVSTANGSASASNSFHYVSALQSYSLPGSSLMQGVYDAMRSVLYFTDQAQIDVFSPAAHNWLAPIPISFTNPNSRLVGVALSPDGNTLAVSDSGNNDIYVLNPSSPNSVKSFFVNTGVDVQPYGLAVTNSGAVYYATYDPNSTGGFDKLDTNTGVITNFEPVKFGDTFVRVLLTPDGSRVFVNEGSGDAGVWVVDTSDDSLTEGNQATLAGDGNEDMALSGDGTVLLASDLLTDDNLNVFGDITYVDRDVWLPLAVYGQKVSSDGSLIFQPLTDGIDVHDGASGLLRYRVQFPVQLANVYDALALDNTNNLIFAIASTGIVQIDLSSLPGNAPSKSEIRGGRSLRHVLPVMSQTKEKGRNWNALERPHLRHLAPPFGTFPRVDSRPVLHRSKGPS